MNTIFKLRRMDFSKFSDEALADALVLLRRQKSWLDSQAEETKRMFKIIPGGKS